MPTRNEMYPSKWLKPDDVDPPVVVTVETCHSETVGQGAKAERKPILNFEGSIKPHIMPATNWDSMVQITGCANSDDWAGARIELYAVDVVGPNGPTRGIRIRHPRARVAKPARPVAPPVNLDDRELDDDIAMAFPPEDVA